MSLFNNNIESKTITEQVFDFALIEFKKAHNRGGNKLRGYKLENGNDLYNYIIRNDGLRGASGLGWSYYLILGMYKLGDITGKLYEYHVDRCFGGDIKAIVVKEK